MRRHRRLAGSSEDQDREPGRDRATPPFSNSDGMLRPGEDLGIGIRHAGRNEIAGTLIAEVLFDYSELLEEILATKGKKG